MFNLFKKKPKISLTPEQLKLNEEIELEKRKIMLEYIKIENEIEDKIEEYRDKLYSDPVAVAKKDEYLAKINKLREACPHLVKVEQLGRLAAQDRQYYVCRICDKYI